MRRLRLRAFRPSRAFTTVYLTSAGLFAFVTFSDDWHAVINDGTAISALSVASGILMGAFVITATRSRR
jgi:low affinity Fe/Cu permease